MLDLTKKLITDSSIIGSIVVTLIVAALITSFSPAAKAQSGPLLLSEIEFDPPSSISEGCQYAELRGTPGSVVAAGTYFLSVDGASGNFGAVTNAVTLGGLTVGANGTITIILDPKAIEACAGRAYGTGTTFVLINDAFQVVGGNISDPSEAESFLLVTSPSALSDGDDIDINNDEVIDPARQITVIDGFAITVNNGQQAAYAPIVYDANTLGGGSAELPDAATRFPSNSAPLSVAAWYYGELASSPDSTSAYSGEPRSANFPGGGALTPGGPNVPAAVNDAPVDFNGDGRTDFAVVRAAGGAGSQLTWFTQFNGGSPFSSRDWGISGDVVISGDFDGDQRDDQAVYRESNSTFYIIESANLTIRIEQFGQSGDNPRVVADYDGDGRDDLALYRPGTQSNWYYKTSQSSLFVAVSWGVAGDTPSPGDYDGDGRADFVVRRASSGAGVFWKRFANATFETEPFGLATDSVVPGDYDGDGKTDLSIVRTSGPNYVWEFEPSGTAGSTVVSDTWGVPGDVIAQGDYDGDGKTDYAVWRPGSPATFLMMTVGTRFITSKLWGQTGDIPVAGYNTF